MNKQMKQLKFTALVEKINDNLPSFVSVSNVEDVSPLNLFFSNQSDNDYLKIILSKVQFELLDWYFLIQEGNGKTNFEDLSTKTSSTKELVTILTESNRSETTLKLIFWALFGLAVDKTDYEEKASLIADFAHVVGIDEKTILDLTQVIKVILGEKEEFEFQTDEVREVFEEVLTVFN